MDKFVNLHAHDHYSTYDGFGTAKQHASRVADLNQPGLGLTNHGNVSGLIEHKLACESVGVKPILGVEAYFQPRYTRDNKRYHMLLFAMSDNGWSNMSRAVTEANRDKFYRMPLMDFDTLEKFNEDLILTTGCLSGLIPRLVQQGKMKKATRVASMYKEIFGDRLYAEVQPHATGPQKGVNERVIRVAEKLDIPIVLTIDSHYMHPKDYPTYEIMFELSHSSHEADYTQKHMPSLDEAATAWKQCRN